MADTKRQKKGSDIAREDVASRIDHTVLKQTLRREDVIKVCQEAKSYRFPAVCIPPYFISLAAKELKETTVHVATVIGFPFGYSSVQAKVSEVDHALQSGATELDIVVNISAIKNGDWEYLDNEIDEILTSMIAHKNYSPQVATKLILETAELTDSEIIKCCQIYGKKTHVNFLKTSTGFAEKGGATFDAVRLLRQHLPSDKKIKVSGGIRDLAKAREMIQLGADRIGCSAGVKIMEEFDGMTASATIESATQSNSSGAY